MNIAILHYHLNPGGVSRIIEMQMEALKGKKEIKKIILLSGAEESSIEIPSNVKFVHNPELNYLNCLELSSREIDKLCSSMDRFFCSVLSKNTILHAHNMNLGKNPILTAVLSNLLKSGVKIINHIHDFAEDRPANLLALEHLIEDHFGLTLKKILYPTDDNCHYAVLNSSYVKRLSKSGIPQENISLLPNPVKVKTIIDHHKARTREKINRQLALNTDLPNFVYPVRGIRRKNLGEFILLAALFKDKANWITTLPPLNPVEKVEYNRWKIFCSKKKIPVIFEAGEKCAFKEVMGAADRSITTSIREGFGMVFLESWFFGLPVVGRDLPVTEDFKKAGIKFEGLYNRIDIKENTDFARLNQEEQMDFISEIIKNPLSGKELIKHNPHLEDIFKDFDINLINSNRKIIKENYSLENYGKKLLDIYTRFV
jgi:glycosyltransferase involved in cell wall biosynthesis